MLKYLVTFTLLLSSLFNLCIIDNTFASTYNNVKLKSCYDGDTCRFYINGVNTPVRFSGIDAPELSQPYGKHSREFLKTVLYGKNIVLNCTGKSYNRKVCTVYNKQGSSLIDVQHVMVLQGYAWDAPKYSKGMYLGAMRQAQKGKKGLWVQPNPQNPSDFRKEKRM